MAGVDRVHLSFVQSGRAVSAVPSGLGVVISTRFPSLKAWAIFGCPIRDCQSGPIAGWLHINPRMTGVTSSQCARKTLANASPPATIAARVSRSAQVGSSSRLSLTGHRVVRMNPFLLGWSLEAELFTFH